MGSSAECRSPVQLKVVVGLIEDAAGNFLIAQRRAGTHMAGLWEFPGGKRLEDESAFAALRRELHEELGLEVCAAERFIVVEHAYADRFVSLDTWLVTDFSGQPRPEEGQALRWVAPEALLAAGLLEADKPIVEALLARDRSGG
jgi:8-oxo-dGTP diphosphatase